MLLSTHVSTCGAANKQQHTPEEGKGRGVEHRVRGAMLMFIDYTVSQLHYRLSRPGWRAQ